jgi:hypothetical protein
MKNERDVKAKVRALLKKHGAWYTTPIQVGYTAAGVPDILVCFKGRFIGIECKYGRNKPTTAQEQQLGAIMRAGGQAMVVNDQNISQLEALLDQEAHGV